MPEPVDYRTAFAALMEQEQELRALVQGHHVLGDPAERGALAEMAERVENLARLYKLTLRLLSELGPVI